VKHKGVSFLEVYQNCNIFNDGAFAAFADKSVRQERMLYLEHGKPLRFGNNMEHGIKLNGFVPEVVQNVESDEGLLVHDANHPTSILANILAGMDYPEFPVPTGIFRQVEAATYDDLVAKQIEDARAKGPGDFAALLNGGETWEVT
jgi:2-oxoglutarate ferredoxin oxidoreductase subunit beta